VLLLVLLVNDSEYSKSTGAKPILSRGCIYLVSPGVLRATTPPRPQFLGEGKYQQKQKKKIVGVWALWRRVLVYWDVEYCPFFLCC
jgi:hypothetical protein